MSIDLQKLELLILKQYSNNCNKSEFGWNYQIELTNRRLKYINNPPISLKLIFINNSSAVIFFMFNFWELFLLRLLYL